MMIRARSLVFLILLVVGLAAVPSHAETFDAVSVAWYDDARNLLVNPAMLRVDQGLRGAYYHTYTDSSFEGDDGLFLATGRIGFGMQWFAGPNAIADRRRTFSTAASLSESFHLGVSRDTYSGRGSDFSSWDVGLLLRPSECVSLGAVARTLNRPDVRTLDLGIGLRPSTDRWTILFGGTLIQDEPLRDASFAYGIDAEPLDGVILSLRADREGDVRLGVTLNFPRVGFGTTGRFEEGYRGGIARVRWSREDFRSLYRSKGRFVALRLSGTFPDAPAGFSPLRRHAPTVSDVVGLLGRARDDDSVAGMILRLGPLDLGFGKLQEIRDALIDIRWAGKTVVCYMESVGNREYFLASACDRIAMSPSGYLGLVGLRMEIPFIKGTLDKLGIRANVEKIGEYKSAADLLTREEMSEPHREMANAILDDMYDGFVGALAEGRGLDRVEIQARIDEGPYTAPEALEAGLVDTILYPDEIEDLARSMSRERFSKIPAGALAGRMFHQTTWGTWPKIAVIYASGTIVTGESGWDFLTGVEMMGSDTISEAIRTAREDPSVRAIVLRIDSGGGSVLASDLIWREMQRTKGKKPLVVSMADIAASGGYCIACMADTIVAEPGTITGSIGVIAGKHDLRGLYDRIGVRKEILARGARASIYTDYEALTEEQRKLVRRQVRATYDDFVQKVAAGRGLPVTWVDSVGRGRVWTGAQAQEIGLVDELGGLDLAIDLARVRAGLSTSPVEILPLPYRGGVLRMLSYDVAAWLRGERLLALPLELEWATLFPKERVLLMMPYRMEIR